MSDRDRSIIACNLYRADADQFKDICRKRGLFHAEVLRALILNYIRKNAGNASEAQNSGAETFTIIADQKSPDTREPSKSGNWDLFKE